MGREEGSGWGTHVYGEGNGNPLQYSCLENPMNKGAWQATVHRAPQARAGPLEESPQASEPPEGQGSPMEEDLIIQFPFKLAEGTIIRTGTDVV